MLVHAAPEEIYEYFTRAEAMVLWMGHYACLDPQPGGTFALDVNKSQIRGRYLELDPPHRLVVSWGFAGSEAVPPGSTTVEVRLQPEAGGTRVEISHAGLPPAEADKHDHGWRQFLPRLQATVEGKLSR